MQISPDLFADIAQEQGAGGTLGFNGFQGLYTESAWIATFCLFIIWLLSLLISPIIVKLFPSTSSGGRETNSAAERMSYFTRACRDAFLIILATTLVNMAGFGINSGVVTLTWIVFGLLVAWIVAIAAGLSFWWLELLLLLPIVVLQIINFALAFRNAPTYGTGSGAAGSANPQSGEPSPSDSQKQPLPSSTSDPTLPPQPPAPPIAPTVEEPEEDNELSERVKQEKERIEVLNAKPSPTMGCECYLIIDADNPSKCRECSGIFREVAKMEQEKTRILAMLEEEQRTLEEMGGKEKELKHEASIHLDKIKRFEDIISGKEEVQARLQRDLQSMGEKIIEEIEKRAELQVSRDALQDELEELTKSLFEEANVMVADEARKRHHHETREKSLEQELANLKLQLQMEQLQLRELQIKMEESKVSAAKNPRAAAISAAELGSSSAPMSRASSGASLNIPISDPIDLMLLNEFQDFLKNGPTVKLNKLHTLPFMKNLIEDDVTPCLRFGGNPRTSTKRLIDSIVMNSCFVEEMSAAQIAAVKAQHQSIKDGVDINSTSNSSAKHSRRASTVDADKGLILSAQATAPTQAIFQKTVLERLSTWSISSSSTTASASIPAAIVVDGCSTCGRIGPTKHHFKISEAADDTWCPICQPCRDRLVAVCEFYNFVRHVRQGLYSTRRHEDLFQEVLTLKRKMFFARVGAFGSLSSERPFSSGRQMLRPDSQLLKDFELNAASGGVGGGGTSGALGMTGSPGLSRMTIMKRLNEDPPVPSSSGLSRGGSASSLQIPLRG
ncbi:RAB3A interacting protein [Blyttiomyces sp. JEL0837]|nr:RAB3A interacting protein [Blyttiomyces sp. JEL0837]